MTTQNDGPLLLGHRSTSVTSDLYELRWWGGGHKADPKGTNLPPHKLCISVSSSTNFPQDQFQPSPELKSQLGCMIDSVGGTLGTFVFTLLLFG